MRKGSEWIGENIDEVFILMKHLEIFIESVYEYGNNWKYLGIIFFPWCGSEIPYANFCGLVVRQNVKVRPI